ncbi:SMP-30/gluconolactonase/LRE family protein [Opitutus terrae]|nr:SMP-30/gluconolactonase/LRE family protein [Opitutus terrae]
MKYLLPLIGLSLPLLSSVATAADGAKEFVERFDPAFDKLVANDAKVERLAEGFRWSEGPVWYHGAVLFSDVPENVVYRWAEGMTKAEVLLKPSGLLQPNPAFREPGSNGLAVDREGRLLLCQHGERRVARYENGRFTTLADRYDGKRLNTPNDLAVRRSGEVYFTDPPYGFKEVDDSPLKELAWHGVYRVAKDGTVTLLTKTIAYPNGIAFSPDEKTLYVGSTEDRNPHIQAFDVQPDGTLANERLFFDGRPHSTPETPGSCDGMKVDRDGNVWTSGPGGILVITPAGKLIGRINTGVPTANCAWGDDGGTLYITANNRLLRVKTSTRGAGW